MEPIYPLNEERIRPFCGNLVCVLMQDGTRHVGVLSSCGKGSLVLNGEREGGGAGPYGGKLHLNQRQSREKADFRKRGKKGKKSAPTAETQAFPFGYGGGAGFYGPRYPFGGELVLDLALIAFLFLLL